MIDKKAAFLAGVSRRCKEAKYDAADEEQIARLLLMEQEKAAFVIGQMIADQRIMEGAKALTKLADIGGFEETKKNPLMQNEEAPAPETPQPEDPDEAALKATEPAPAGPAGGVDDTVKTDSANTQSPAPISLNDPLSEQEKAEMKDFEPLSIETTNQQGDRENTANLQDQAIARGFQDTVTPFMERQGVTGDWLRQLQQQKINTTQDRQHVRNVQKAYGWNFMPIRGGLRPSDIDPSQVSDPMRRKSLEIMKNYLAEREGDARAVGGLRSGWSTYGSSFKGGGERAMRGRPPGQSATQQAQSTAQAATGQQATQTAAGESAGTGNVAKKPMTMGQANRARIPQLQEQNKQWSIRDASGNVVRSGRWSAPKPPAQPPTQETSSLDAQPVEEIKDLEPMEKLPLKTASLYEHLVKLANIAGVSAPISIDPKVPAPVDPKAPAPTGPSVRFNPQTATWDQFKKWRNLMNTAGNAQWAQYWHARGINPGERKPIFSQEDQKFVDYANPYHGDFWTGMEGDPIEMHSQLREWNPMLADQIEHYNKLQQEFKRTGEKPIPGYSEHTPYGTPESWATAGRDFEGEEKQQLTSATQGLTPEQQTKLQALPNDTQRKSMLSLWRMKDYMQQRKEQGLDPNPTPETTRFNLGTGQWEQKPMQEIQEDPQKARIRQLNAMEMEKRRNWDAAVARRRQQKAVTQPPPPPTAATPKQDVFAQRVASRRGMNREQLIADEVRRWREAGKRTGTTVPSEQPKVAPAKPAAPAAPATPAAPVASTPTKAPAAQPKSLPPVAPPPSAETLKLMKQHAGGLPAGGTMKFPDGREYTKGQMDQILAG